MTTKLQALKDSHLHGLEFRFSRYPKCPHCGDDYDIDRNESYDLYDDDRDHDVTCPSCELDFSVCTHKSFAFSTDEQPEGDE